MAARSSSALLVATRKAHVLDHSFWLSPGHASESGTWYPGSSPQELALLLASPAGNLRAGSR